MATLDCSTNTCKACNAEKSIGDFYQTRGRFGRLYADNTCKTCRSAKNQSRKKAAIADPDERERRRIWRREHKRKMRAARGCRLRAELTAAAMAKAEAKDQLAADRKMKRNAPDAHVKRWREVVAARKRQKAKRQTPKGCLDDRMKVSIGKALKGQKGGRKWEKLVGYSLAELMQHLERQFTKGMGWHNMGAWHIDHRRPRASFEYHGANDQSFKDCWSLTNLQPMWKTDNLVKGAKVVVLI